MGLEEQELEAEAAMADPAVTAAAVAATHGGVVPAALESTADVPHKRVRKPLDEEARRRRAERDRARRLLARLKDAENEEELRAKAAELLGAPVAAPESPSVESAPHQAAPAIPTMEPGQRPGWPPPSLVAEFSPVALQLWDGARRVLPARYASALEARTINGQEVRPVELLAHGTAPVLAKWVPEVATTPEAALAVAVVTVFGPVALAHAKELVGAWLASREDARATEGEAK
ncbi:MAG: hypothetical protein ACOZIN_08510 [Myxococcota bacterium]